MKRAHNKSAVKKEVKEFDEEVIQIDRVTKVVKGGRKLRFRATVCVGNRKGKVGVGVGKSNEVTGAIQKAISKAKKDMVQVVMDENTIPHSIQIKLKSSKILLMPASPGTGIIAGGTVRKVLELTGIKDILSKSFGTTNKVNNSKATLEALRRLKSTPVMERKAKNKVAASVAPKVNQVAPKANEAQKATAKPASKATSKSAQKPKAQENN